MPKRECPICTEMTPIEDFDDKSDMCVQCRRKVRSLTARSRRPRTRGKKADAMYRTVSGSFESGKRR